MSFLILVRHGQSIWNLEKRFTGWVDVDLTEQGKAEAEKAGVLIKEKNININFYYSSLQLRANNTLKIIQKVLNDNKNFIKAWQLNERHYGALTGLNKIEMSNKIGENKIKEFRRSWDIKPEALKKDSPFHPMNIKTYEQIPKEFIPDTESLKDTYERVVNFFQKEIKEKLKTNVFEVLDSMDVKAFTDNQKLKYLQVVLPYLTPKKKEVYNDIPEDVPLFIDEPPKILVFTSAEQKQAYDRASEEEKLEMEKELIC